MHVHVSGGPFRPYWFPASPALGIGVTACTPMEAQLLAQSALPLLPPGSTLTGEMLEGVDARAPALSPVLPTAGPLDVHGVWYPHGR